MKRTPLTRRTPLKQGGSLKRTALKRVPCTLERSLMPKINKVRAAKHRARDFGPHGDIVVPTLPCVVCRWPWWATVPDETLAAMMERALAEPDRYARVSEPAHVTRSRGAGGDASCLLPLCGVCHREQHASGILTFAATYPAIPFAALAARLWRLSPARILMEDI